MNLFQILDCNSNLGNCCSNNVVTSLLSPIINIIDLIQVIVPIILLIMVAVNLTQLVLDPEDKKKVKSLKTKFFAALFVFAVPVIINAFILMIDDSGTGTFNVLNCIKQSSNVKYNSNTSYISTTDKKTSKIISDPSDYEKGKERSSVPTGAISDACVLGDSNVKLVPNDSKKVDTVVAKANGQDVANYAKSWLNQGLTYKLGSSGELRPGGQCDCSHFVYKVLMHFNILKGGQIRSTVWGSCGVKGSVMYSSYDKLVPGDVVFKSFGNAVGHVEIYIGNGETIGCNGGKGITHGTHAKNYTSFIHLTAYD